MAVRIIQNGMTIEFDSLADLPGLAERLGLNGEGTKRTQPAAVRTGSTKSWARARKVAKKLDRQDVAQVRRELAAGTLRDGKLARAK
jgi:hypothetical protein